MEKNKVNNTEQIDFVITWVNGADSDWRITKQKYSGVTEADDADERYRDWGLLPYWFRGVETFAPWVRKVHFITSGHLPPWLNTSHPKLHIVCHRDYLPEDACPTFNSNAIELPMHRIEGLAEQFVYFNDDMFLLRPVSKELFFRNGLPCDDAILSPVMPNWGEEIARTVLNNMQLINRHFSKQHVFRAHAKLFFSPKYGKEMLRTFCLLPWRHFPGFKNDHLPIAYLRSTFERVWEKEQQVLDATVHHRFRCYNSDVNHWLMRYWQFCTGQALPASPGRGKDLPIDSPSTLEAILCQRYSMICINDSAAVNGYVEQVQAQLKDAFSQILPQPSGFEKS